MMNLGHRTVSPLVSVQETQGSTALECWLVALRASEIVSVYSIGTCCGPTNRCLASARSSDLRILPVSVIGRASTKTTWRGILKLAILLRQQAITSSTLIEGGQSKPPSSSRALERTSREAPSFFGSKTRAQ